MWSSIGTKIIEVILSQLGSLVMRLINDYLTNRKDKDDINDAFNETDEGAVAGGLNDVFRG